MRKLFIHIPKNAGSTIKKSESLKNKIVCATKQNKIVDKDYLSKLEQTMQQLAGTNSLNVAHARWRDILPEYRNTHRAFAVIRNPWSRVVSRFRFAKKLLQNNKVGKDHVNVSSFEAFIDDRHKYGNVEFMWHRAIQGWFPAFDHVSDENENIRCDILRFETIDDELCRYFDIPKMTRPHNITFQKEGVYTNYQDFYTPETIQIVADWYQKDIETWGFDFDSSATRNYFYDN